MERTTGACAVAVCLALAGCGEDREAPRPIEEHECLDARLGAQPARRFPLGETYWLPRLSAEGACGALRWSIARAPEAAVNEVVRGADGFDRLTPDATGEYLLRLSDGRAELTLGVVDPREFPFHNVSYPPTRSVAAVGDVVWTANVLTPTLTRVGASDLAVRGTVVVGAWPVAHARELGVVVVAQRGSDTLGLVDVATQRIVDAIWVGDEPANLVLSPDQRTAYVALATEGAIAEVDLESRALTRRLDAIADLLGLAIARDGSRLYAATHRSGHPSRQPYGDDPVDEKRDVVAIDLATGAIAETWVDVGTAASTPPRSRRRQCPSRSERPRRTRRRRWTMVAASPSTCAWSSTAAISGSRPSRWRDRRGARPGDPPRAGRDRLGRRPGARCGSPRPRPSSPRTRAARSAAACSARSRAWATPVSGLRSRSTRCPRAHATPPCATGASPRRSRRAPASASRS